MLRRVCLYLEGEGGRSQSKTLRTDASSFLEHLVVANDAKQQRESRANHTRNTCETTANPVKRHLRNPQNSAKQPAK
eukprot:2007037-Prymnesium_polylepis.1